MARYNDRGQGNVVKERRQENGKGKGLEKSQYTGGDRENLKKLGEPALSEWGGGILVETPASDHIMVEEPVQTNKDKTEAEERANEISPLLGRIQPNITLIEFDPVLLNSAREN